MKFIVKKSCILVILGCLVFSGCSKSGPVGNSSSPGVNPPPPPGPPQPPPSPVYNLCTNRPYVQANLVPFGTLSENKIVLVSGTVGTKIFFAGGAMTGAHSTTVDIYDTASGSWSTANLSQSKRDGMVVATVGNKIFFAGGGDNDWYDITSRVDIYNTTTNTWSVAELSSPRKYMAAATLGNKVFFAGGSFWNMSDYEEGSNIVDIYDNTTNTWSVQFLSEGRYDLTATVVGQKIYFAGGDRDMRTISNRVDIYDGVQGTWTSTQLTTPRASHGSIAFGNKVFWAGGRNTSFYSGGILSGTIEIFDDASGSSTFECMIPKAFVNAVKRGDNLLFFPGNYNSNTYSGRTFEIYNTVTNQWSTGVLSSPVFDATVIAVNNNIYIAGGRDVPWGPYFNTVWKLEF